MRELGLDAYRFSIAWPRVLPDGPRAGERGRPRLLRPARRRAARARHRAVRDALPLGPAAGARGRGRLAGARDRRGVRRVRRGRRAAPRRPRPPLDHAQRAVGRSPGSATAGASTRPGRTSEADARRRRAPPAALARLGGRGDPRATLPARRSGSRSTSSPSHPAHGLRGRRAAARHVDGDAQPLVPRPDLPRRVPGGHARALRAGRAAGRRTATWQTIAAPLDFLGVNYYSPHRRQRRAAGRRRVVRAPTARPAHGHGLGGLPGRALRAPRARSRDDYDAAARSTSPRTAPRSPTSAARRPRATTRSGRRTSSATSTRVARAIDDGVPVRGLLRLVAARQLRVGVRLLEALRDRLRRLRDARARAEGRASTGTATSSRPSGLASVTVTRGRRHARPVGRRRGRGAARECSQCWRPRRQAARTPRRGPPCRSPWP